MSDSNHEIRTFPVQAQVASKLRPQVGDLDRLINERGSKIKRGSLKGESLVASTRLNPMPWVIFL